MRLSLVGFMASGKSLYGQTLAGELGFAFYDTDEIISRKTGKDIPAIFTDMGEKFFRDEEISVTNELMNKEDCVISTGGGLPMQENLMQVLLENTLTIFLKPTLDELYTWLLKDRQVRPLLKEIPDNRLEEHIRKLYYQRLPFYKKAHLVITPAELKPEFLAKYILANYTRP